MANLGNIVNISGTISSGNIPLFNGTRWSATPLPPTSISGTIISGDVRGYYTDTLVVRAQSGDIIFSAAISGTRGGIITWPTLRGGPAGALGPTDQTLRFAAGATQNAQLVAPTGQVEIGLGSSGAKFPTADGTSGQILITNGIGSLNWGAAATSITSGSVTSGYIGNNAVLSGNIGSGQIGFRHIAHNEFAGFFLSGDTPAATDNALLFLSGIIQFGSGSTAAGIYRTSGQFWVDVLGFQDLQLRAAGGYVRLGTGASTVKFPNTPGNSGQILTTDGSNTLSWNAPYSLSSGVVTSGFIGDAAVNSGNIASGSIGRMHLSSGAVNSGHIANAAVVSGSIASGQVGWVHHSSGAVRSGHIADTAVTSGNISSGSVSNFHLASGAINSGHVGSGSIQGFFGGGARTIGSGTVGSFDLGSGAVMAGAIGSGAVQSGNIASGQIGQNHLSSGLSIQGTTTAIYITGEPISGTRAVAINTSGQAVIAMAGQSGRMPAIGILATNVASGIAAQVTIGGQLATPVVGGYSGFIGLPVWTGLSGTLETGQTLLPGSGLNQILGTATTSGGLLVNPALIISGSYDTNIVTSGGYTTLATYLLTNAVVASGSILSGQINKFSLSSGCVNSGHIANTAVNSGNISSGQVGRMHHSSGSINSGHINDAAVVSGSIASGTAVNFTRVQYTDAFATVETISGFRCVSLSSGGALVTSMAGSGLRMPSIGVTMANYLSGATALIATHGRFITTSGLDATWSGRVGQSLYVGSGGTLITSSGFVSGQFMQKMGVAVSGGIYVNVNQWLFSGGPTVSWL